MLFLQCRTKQERLACGLRLLGLLFLSVLLFLVNAALLMAFSYASYSKLYNMTSGCPFSDANCTETLMFYHYSDLTSWASWTSLLVLIELAILAFLLLIAFSVKRRYDTISPRYSKMEELREFPSTPTDFEPPSSSLVEEAQVLLEEARSGEKLSFREGLRLIYLGNVLNSADCSSAGYHALVRLDLSQDAI